MGIKLFRSSSIFETHDKLSIRDSKIQDVLDKNPDPSNWRIIRHLQIDKWLLVELVYPNCVNYEGRKILLFRGCTLVNLTQQKLIDPHFSDNDQWLSPIARFEPTENGWEMGKSLMK